MVITKILTAIVDRLTALTTSNRPLLVGITEIDGSGKTTSARQLAANRRSGVTT
ncbi:MAG: hypothetical protein AB1331_01665 [Bacillota bacterium]